MEADTVERILRDRGISVDKAVLANALQSSCNDELGDENSPASFANWATQYLERDTLLTPDEIDTFSSLVELGLVDSIEASAAFESAGPRDQEELHAAVRELNKSTAAIGKQTETLKQQQEALAKFAKARINSEAERSDLDAALLQRRAAEGRNVKSLVDELSRSLEIKVSDVKQQSESGIHHLGQNVNDVLAADDKLLTSLEKLGGELSLSGDQDDRTVEALRQVCMRLIKCTVEMMRCRLDRLYLEGLAASSTSGSRGKKTMVIQELQGEVDSLYSELLPVAQMSVENQFLEPALKSLTTRNRESLSRATTAVDYICECLDYLQERLDVLLSRVEMLQSHRVAAEAFSAAAVQELAVSVASRPRKREDEATTRSPTRRRRSSGQTSPARVRSNTVGSGLQRRRSSGTVLDEPPLEALLRALAVPLHPDTDGVEGAAKGRERTALLSNLLADRTAKVDDIAANTQQGFESTAAIHLGDAEKAVRLLRDSVLADSPYRHVRLIDPEIAESIAFLEQEVRKLCDQIGQVDPALGRSESLRRKEILQRWG